MSGSHPVRGGIPAITTDQMREVDLVMIEDLGIELIQMMENAGANLARLADTLYSPSRVTVLAGRGGNGGGGLAAARHLANRGVEVSVVVTAPLQEMAPVPAHQTRILERMAVAFPEEPGRADLVLDAVIGYSLSGDPRGRAAELIEWADGSAAPILALDAPSGLDAATGLIGDPCIRADATMTLALPKVGLFEAPEVVGDLYLADISVPPSVYAAFGIALADPFSEGPVVRIG